MRSLLPALLAAALFAQAPDEESCKKALAISPPANQLSAILHFLTQYPNSRSVPLMINQAYAAAKPSGRLTAVQLADEISRRLAKASPMARSEAERTIALIRGLPPHDAERYARQAIADLNAGDYVARERRQNGEKAFHSEEALEKYRSAEAAAWSGLGSILIWQGRDAEARQALQKSLAAARTAEAATAFAGLAAKEGDIHTVLDALGTAVLTGRADRPTIEKFQTAYRESGMRPNPEQWLDRRYRMESRNPLEAAPYRGSWASPRRAVLLEITTAADCEPCVSVDLATDALLHRYSRQDLVVLAHHFTVAPVVILDGAIIEPGKGLASVSKPVFEALDAAIQKRIAAAPETGLQLKSSWSDRLLNVDAIVEGGEGAKLQIYLVETEVSYSGANGIRLHPMVTRSAAGIEQGGFDVAGQPFRAQWSFATARLNTARLAIVAVVRDTNTRRVLQSAFLPVEVKN